MQLLLRSVWGGDMITFMSIYLFQIVMVIFAPMQYLMTGSCMVKISGDDFTFIGRKEVPIL